MVSLKFGDATKICAVIRMMISYAVVILYMSSIGGIFQGQISFGYISSGLCASRVLIYGYPCTEYKVQTADGFILGMQRIPHGITSDEISSQDRPPVFLMHGVLAAGDIWLLNSAEESLGFILADKGFDVWIGSNRGTSFSPSHISLSQRDPEYWDWTFDELSEIDLSTMIGFIFNITGKPINYIGHSQGTLLVLMALSQGNLMEKLKSISLLCPVAYDNQTRSLVVNLGFRLYLDKSYQILFPVFNPARLPGTSIIRSICSMSGVVDCSILVSTISGPNCCLNTSLLAFYSQYESQPTSSKNLVHFGQLVRSGKIQRYDYGRSGNIQYYGQVEPPMYNLSSIPATVDIFVGYGGRDAEANPKDVQRLLRILNIDKIRLNVVFVKDYAHYDFVLGTRARYDIYKDLVTFIQSLYTLIPQ